MKSRFRILLTGLTAVFLLAVVTLPAFGRYSEQQAAQPGAAYLSLPVLTALVGLPYPDHHRRLAERHRHQWD